MAPKIPSLALLFLYFHEPMTSSFCTSRLPVWALLLALLAPASTQAQTNASDDMTPAEAAQKFGTLMRYIDSCTSTA